MTVAIFILYVVMSAGVPAAYSECDVELQLDIRESDGYILDFTCVTKNLRATYPRWEINGKEYEVTKLPPHFAVRGLMSLEFKLRSSVKVRCFFKQFEITNRSVVPICSDAATVDHTINDMVPMCKEENVIFFKNGSSSSFFLGNVPKDCKMTVNVSRCGTETELPVTCTYEDVGVCMADTEEIFRGENVTVTIDNDCDVCDETRIHIPGPVQRELITIPCDHKGPIKDLSNNYCDFGSAVIDYKICIHSEGSTECFKTPCGNDQIYTSLCKGRSQDNEAMSLEVDGIKNGTIVTIYCQREDCRGNPSNLMVFNIEIVTYENSKNMKACEQTEVPPTERTEKNSQVQTVVISIAIVMFVTILAFLLGVRPF